MRWTEDDLKMVQERIANARDKNRSAVQTTNGKQGACNESLGPEAFTRPDGPVDITVTSYLNRERDPDGDFFKYTLDAIVDAGILQNDTGKEIKEIRHRQEHSKIKGHESTEIIIAWSSNTPNSPVERKQGKGKEKLSWD